MGYVAVSGWAQTDTVPVSVLACTPLVKGAARAAQSDCLTTYPGYNRPRSITPKSP